MTGEREKVAEELRRIREAVQEGVRPARDAASVLGSLRPLRAREPVPAERVSPEVPPPERPDAGDVNRLWKAEAPAEGGAWGRLRRLVETLLGPRLLAQVAWNAKQVQLDNALLDYVDARLAHTHHHYDGVLGLVGRHLGEADERHLILQEELVAHVHDLAQRIDLVLAEGERARVSLEFALQDLRERVRRLEERLARG
jgi:hypothetical protein